jgi:hypothetical protein
MWLLNPLDTAHVLEEATVATQSRGSRCHLLKVVSMSSLLRSIRWITVLLAELGFNWLMGLNSHMVTITNIHGESNTQPSILGPVYSCYGAICVTHG